MEWKLEGRLPLVSSWKRCYSLRLLIPYPQMDTVSSQTNPRVFAATPYLPPPSPIIFSIVLVDH